VKGRAGKRDWSGASACEHGRRAQSPSHPSSAASPKPRRGIVRDFAISHAPARGSYTWQPACAHICAGTAPTSAPGLRRTAPAAAPGPKPTSASGPRRRLHLDGVEVALLVVAAGDVDLAVEHGHRRVAALAREIRVEDPLADARVVPESAKGSGRDKPIRSPGGWLFVRSFVRSFVGFARLSVCLFVRLSVCCRDRHSGKRTSGEGG
jgi:hypothetical protein